jgi:KaiC/GvpD/RAD55 family RecA-like ATPase
MSRITTGMKDLDALIDGGLPTNTAVLLSGGPGTGKTLFGLNFLAEGVAKGERSCYISFNETKNDLLRACEGIKTLKNVKKNEKFIIKDIDLGMDVSVTRFMETIDQYPKFDRLVIDNLNKLLLFADSKRQYRTQLDTLTRYLREKIACSLLICETDGDKIDAGQGEAFECDGVVNLSFLEFEEKPKRTLHIEKMRYTSFEPKVAYTMIIDKNGLRLSKEKII